MCYNKVQIPSYGDRELLCLYLRVRSFSLAATVFTTPRRTCSSAISSASTVPGLPRREAPCLCHAQTGPAPPCSGPHRSLRHPARISWLQSKSTETALLLHVATCSQTGLIVISLRQGRGNAMMSYIPGAVPTSASALHASPSNLFSMGLISRPLSRMPLALFRASFSLSSLLLLLLPF